MLRDKTIDAIREDGIRAIARSARRILTTLAIVGILPMAAVWAQAPPPGFGPGPFDPSPPPAVANPAAIPAMAQGVLIDTRKLVEMVRLELDASPVGQQLGARVNVMLGTADNFNRALNGRIPPPQQFESLIELHRAHQLVSSELAQPAVFAEAPGSARMNQRIGARIQQIRSSWPTPGPMPGPGVVPGSGLMPGPAPGPPPGPVPGPPPREVLLHRVLSRELTGLITEVDLFVGGLNPKVPEGPQLQGEAIALQNALRTVRRDFNRPRPEPVLVSDFNHAVGTHRVLAARVERLNRGRSGPNVQRIRNIGATLARIQQGVPGL